jgi:hypothetical protein
MTEENNIVIHLRRRAAASGDVIDGRLDTLAVDEIERLRDIVARDGAELDRLAAITHAGEAEYERLFEQFGREINRTMLPPVIQEMVDLIRRTAPSISQAEAIDLIEKAAAKVFNEDYKS